MQSRIANSTYHSVLRIALCVFAVVLLFDSGLVSKNTTLLSSSAQDYVASAVGVKVGVAPNEINQLTGRITQLEQELALKEREIAVNLSKSQPQPGFSTSTFILSIVLFILLVLIVLNYALDYLRMTDPRRSYQQKILT